MNVRCTVEFLNPKPSTSIDKMLCLSSKAVCIDIYILRWRVHAHLRPLSDEKKKEGGSIKFLLPYYYQNTCLLPDVELEEAKKRVRGEA